MGNITESANAFLEKTYQDLGYQDGMLLNAVQIPQANSDEAQHWLEKGEWLATAKKANVQKVFFVNDDPVIVFSDFEQVLDEDEILDIFRRVWCMARPQRLFLALPGELRVYDLNQAPQDGKGENNKLLYKKVERVADVLEKLNDYRREFIESGFLPDIEYFGKPGERADRRLIQDLQIVCKDLINTTPGLEPKYAHALIGRSIFIRYLEDRKILQPQYFEEVAKNRPKWMDLLSKPPEKIGRLRIIHNEQWENRRYYRVLQDKDFTYALFDKLADDFNGDLFPRDKKEKEKVQPEHLKLLCGFLLGETDQKQPNLFFWAYDFEIIPIELISNIYEEFYHKRQEDDKGTHYTPGVLVEFVLSHVLPKERLASDPKILDPACGSGIFLVEAFRRIVRYRMQKYGRPLSAIELREILHHQIRGIEIDQGAIYVTAFSLYLALLHYQSPPDILAQIEMPESDTKPLPNLVYNKEKLQEPNYYHILFSINTFALMNVEREQLEQELEDHPRRTRLKSFCESSEALPLGPNSFDIIIGNPPWGFIQKKNATPEIQKAQTQAREWCERFGWSIGDNELSQAFIARTLSLLKAQGDCGFLISTGVFFKSHSNSQQFRQRWLRESTIKTVVNFAHVRDIFFSNAISPFAFVHYKAFPAEISHRIHYWSAKRTKVIENMRSVVLNLPDIRQVRQSDLTYNEQLWKVYWWGNHRDAALINVLNLDRNLGSLVEGRDWENGQGYTPGSENVSNRDVYKITQRAFTQLSKENIPANILTNLKSLKKQNNKNKEQFLRVLEKTLGEEQAIRYSHVIMHHARKYLNNYQELSVDKSFRRYGLINQNELKKVPQKVHRYGDFGVYTGWRLVIKRGITQKEGANGRIDTRLEDKPYCFRNSAHGISVENAEEWERKVLIGILWSSLARYYYFMTVGSWMTWHCEIHFKPIMSLPIRFPKDIALRERIIRIVAELMNWNPEHHGILSPTRQSGPEISMLERELDEAIFDLYELSEPERDLILDICEVGLEFFYRHGGSNAVQSVENYPIQRQGIMNNLPKSRSQERGLEGYLYAFLEMWNDELAPDGEFYWQIIRPDRNPMLAIIFSIKDKGRPLPELADSIQEWSHVLGKIDKAAQRRISPQVYIDGMVRMVTDTEIFIIKRKERRLWTRSLAREDAEATLLQAIHLQKAHRNKE